MKDLAYFLEEIAANGHVALNVMQYDGWLLRFSGGFTGRANSISVIYPSRKEMAEKVEYCEKCYAKQGLPTLFKLTEYDTELSDYLKKRGYEVVTPTDVMILEGIHCFYDKRLTDLMFLKLYMKVEPDICLLRRIERDIVERGRDIQGIGEQYLNSVKPMFDRYIRNYVKDADVIVANGGKNARIVDILAGYVQDELGKRE